jgi:hypothetical protein
MGLGRRIVRKTVRKATPRPVRQAMHPARTVKNAVTPRPVRQVSRAVYTARNPVGAAENKVIGAALNAGSRRRGSGLGLFGILFGRKSGNRRQPDCPAAAAPTATARRENPPQNAARAPQPPPQAKPIRKVPARPPVRIPPAKPVQSSGGAGDWELEMRRQVGLGGDRQNPGQPKAE